MKRHNLLTAYTVLQVAAEDLEMTDAGPRDPQPTAQRRREQPVSLFGTRGAPAGTDLPANPRKGRGVFSAPLSLSAVNPARVWESLSPVTLDNALLDGNGLFTHPGSNPAAQAFDILRTRLLQAMEDRDWHRIAVTSPTHGCGKSFVAANLALSLSRRPSSRTVLMDLELRNPSLAGLFGLPGSGAMRDFLTAAQPLESHFRRVGRTLALGLNGVPVTGAAELLQEPDTAAALAAMHEQLCPDIVIHDLPPALAGDDVIAMLPQVDAVLLVVDGTRTTAADVKACERLFADRTPLMGVVLNRAQDRDLGRYAYGSRT